MVVTEFPMLTFVNSEHRTKAELPISFTLLGIKIVCNLEQYAKFQGLTFFKFSESFTEVKAVQSLKAEVSIFSTLLGISTEVKLEQLSKAHPPISLTLLGISTEVKPVHS